VEKTPFHILSVEGLPKTGKTHLYSTAPGGIGVQSLDFGTEGVIDKFPDTYFDVREYNFAYDYTIKSRGDEATDQADRIKTDYWAPFNDDAISFFGDPSIRTVVWDTASEVWEMLRLAHFGKLMQNPQMQYGVVNAEYKALVRMANTARKNLILIHHMNKEYKDVDDGKGGTKSVESGNYKRIGNNKIENLVHSYVRTIYDEPVKNSKGIISTPGKFKIEVIRSRYNPDMNGMVLDACGFVDLMGILHPHVEADAWLK
jgi:superfamily I DNA and/or RNA helicase